MLALAGYPLDMSFRFFDPAPDAPAGQVAEHVVGRYGDFGALERFARGVDVITYEFENVPLEAVRFLGEKTKVYPPTEALSLSQDRLTEKNGAVSRALAPGGIIDQLTAEGGLIDRMTTDDGAVSRVIAPGGLADQLLANDGLIERVLREDGVADRLLAEGGLLDTLTAEDGPLLKLADVADTLNRLTPGLEALAPTIDALHDAVVTLSQVVNPLSNIADRIPLPGWRPRARSSSRTVTSQRVIDADE